MLFTLLKKQLSCYTLVCGKASHAMLHDSDISITSSIKWLLDSKCHLIQHHSLLVSMNVSAAPRRLRYLTLLRKHKVTTQGITASHSWVPRTIRPEYYLCFLAAVNFWSADFKSSIKKTIHLEPSLFSLSTRSLWCRETGMCCYLGYMSCQTPKADFCELLKKWSQQHNFISNDSSICFT